jgi:hypothetical protein
MAQERPGNPFPGRRGAPDMPSAADEKRLAREPTDDNLQHFMDVFGEEALGRTGRKAPRNEVPRPRPRYPDVESDIMGGYTRLSPDEMQRQGADLRPQDIDRMRQPKAPDDYDQEPLTAEQELELVQRGLAPRR